jgi:ketosteroid isomerase-like protein
MTDTNARVDDFFDRYGAALLARDAPAVARLYAVPSLILFPGQSLPVTDRAQTENFFAASWGQYEGVDAIDSTIRILAETTHSVWAEVTWTYNGAPREHFCYQLVDNGDGFEIAVLTPMA